MVRVLIAKDAITTDGIVREPRLWFLFAQRKTKLTLPKCWVAWFAHHLPVEFLAMTN